MVTYRIVDMYSGYQMDRGLHLDSFDEPIYAYRVDKQHCYLFGLIRCWRRLRPECLFPSVIEAKEAILKASKGRVTILYPNHCNTK